MTFIFSRGVDITKSRILFLKSNLLSSNNENMNLFILSLIQREIAQFMMDKHVSKILLEAVQMLCSAKRILDPDDTEVNDRIYKLAHKNHPVTIWCRKSRANFVWTLDLVEELHNDYRDLTQVKSRNCGKRLWTLIL